MHNNASPAKIEKYIQGKSEGMPASSKILPFRLKTEIGNMQRPKQMHKMAKFDSDCSEMAKNSRDRDSSFPTLKQKTRKCIKQKDAGVNHVDLQMTHCSNCMVWIQKYCK